MHLYDGRVLGFSGNAISIKDSLGDEFNYAVMINGDTAETSKGLAG